MSNLTDGKKALAAGEFDAAEKKLLKALDKRPDDSRLWWALFLCRRQCRDDGELSASLAAEFERAADGGERPPHLPFDDTACKNALAFDRDGRNRSVVEQIQNELSELWQAKRGKPLKARRTASAYRPVDRASVLGGASYLIVLAVAVGAALIVYAVSTAARWALWTGAAVFVTSTVAMLAVRFLLKRAGGENKLAFGLTLGVYGVFAFALVIVGMFTGLTYASFIGGGVLAVLVTFLFFKVFRVGKDKQPRGGNSGRQSPAREKKPKAERPSDYTDDFD